MNRKKLIAVIAIALVAVGGGYRFVLAKEAPAKPA